MGRAGDLPGAPQSPCQTPLQGVGPSEGQCHPGSTCGCGRLRGRAPATPRLGLGVRREPSSENGGERPREVLHGRGRGAVSSVRTCARVRQMGGEAEKRPGAREAFVECGDQSCQNESPVRLRPSCSLCPWGCPSNRRTCGPWARTQSGPQLPQQHARPPGPGLHARRAPERRVCRVQSGQGEFLVGVRVAGLGGQWLGCSHFFFNLRDREEHYWFVVSLVHAPLGESSMHHNRGSDLQCWCLGTTLGCTVLPGRGPASGVLTRGPSALLFGLALERA